MFPDDDNWKLFRTIEAAPAGTFAADGDWAGGDAFALTLENGIISIPRDHDHQVVDLGTVILYAVVTTADRAAIVARANMTFNVQAVELVQRVVYGCWNRAGGLAYSGAWAPATMAPMGIMDAHRPESWGFKHDVTEAVAMALVGAKRGKGSVQIGDRQSVAA